VTWDEVRRCLDGRHPSMLSFEADAALRRVEKRGDLFAPLVSLKQKLPRLRSGGRAAVIARE
jgi:bifunctional non-homologous end joining protein LigD